jgi:hypothetical protein
MRSTDRGLAVFVEIPAELIADAPAEPLAWSGGPARWITTEQGAIVGGTSLAGPSVSEPAAARRGAPTRAEDVLGAGRGERGGVWWSRRPVEPATGVPASASPSEVDESGGSDVPDDKNGAGLPVRVPMANLPRQQSARTAMDALPPTEPDPEEVGNVLSSFYRGVHLAALEDDDLESAVNGPGAP